MKKLKYLVTVTGILLIVCIIITSYFYPEANNTAPGSESRAAVENGINNTFVSYYPEISSGYKYYLTIKNGRVAVYDSSLDEIEFISDAGAADLPETDRKALEKGIPARDRVELKRLLEEYCS